MSEASSNQPAQPTTKPKKVSRGCVIGFLVAAAFVCAIFAGAIWVIKSTSMHHLKSNLWDISEAMTHYKAHHGRWPFIAGAQNATDTIVRSKGQFIHDLLDLGNTGDKFLDYWLAKNGTVNGFIDSSSPTEVRIVDYWGEEFYLVIDTNNDGGVANPEDVSNRGWFTRREVPSIIPRTVIVYSAGPDRDPQTWYDNVCSWRGTEPLLVIKLNSMLR
ncbi:MAG: hypothetical protein V4662_19580 [Verrucomicrobiota bacterium]